MPYRPKAYECEDGTDAKDDGIFGAIKQHVSKQVAPLGT